jgi:hypothetical protein
MKRKLNHRKAMAAAAYIIENRSSSEDRGLDVEDLFEEAIGKARSNVLDTRRDNLGRDLSTQSKKPDGV